MNYAMPAETSCYYSINIVLPYGVPLLYAPTQQGSRNPPLLLSKHVTSTDVGTLCRLVHVDAADFLLFPMAGQSWEWPGTLDTLWV